MFSPAKTELAGLGTTQSHVANAYSTGGTITVQGVPPGPPPGGSSSVAVSTPSTFHPAGRQTYTTRAGLKGAVIAAKKYQASAQGSRVESSAFGGPTIFNGGAGVAGLGDLGKFSLKKMFTPPKSRVNIIKAALAPVTFGASLLGERERKVAWVGVVGAASGAASGFVTSGFNPVGAAAGAVTGGAYGIGKGAKAWSIGAPMGRATYQTLLPSAGIGAVTGGIINIAGIAKPTYIAKAGLNPTGAPGPWAPVNMPATTPGPWGQGFVPSLSSSPGLSVTPAATPASFAGAFSPVPVGTGTVLAPAGLTPASLPTGGILSTPLAKGAGTLAKDVIIATVPGLVLGPKGGIPNEWGVPTPGQSPVGPYATGYGLPLPTGGGASSGDQGAPQGSPESGPMSVLSQPLPLIALAAGVLYFLSRRQPTAVRYA